MLPSFRWRWERKELNNGHPLIATLAEKVFGVIGVSLCQAGSSSHPVVMPEVDLDLEGTSSPIATHTTASTPSLSNTYTHGASGMSAFPGSPLVEPALPTTSRAHVPGGSGGSTNDPMESKLVEVPVNLFYPFYPDDASAQTWRDVRRWCCVSSSDGTPWHERDRDSGRWGRLFAASRAGRCIVSTGWAVGEWTGEIYA